MRFCPRPLQFGPGLSNLWRGFERCGSTGITTRPEGLFFCSARAGIAFTIKQLPSEYGDNVIAAGFTCSAVTDAITAAGKKTILVDINRDFSLNEAQIDKHVDNGAQIILVQHTLGKMGLREEKITQLKARGVFIIIDNSLSYGTLFKGEDIGSLGHVEIQSYEVSKTITCGWGGRVTFHDIEFGLKSQIELAYLSLQELAFLTSLREKLQLEISSFYIENYRKHGAALWYLLYAMKIFKRSNIKLKDFNQQICKINQRTFPYLERLLQNSEKIYERVTQNYNDVKNLCIEHSLDYVRCEEEDADYRIVAPRFTVVLRKPCDLTVEQLFLDNRIDIGRWFQEVPIHGDEHNLKNTFFFNKHVINVPVHHTLKKSELERINNLFCGLSRNGY